MSEKKLFKPNVVYVVEIHGCQYYVGCHCHKKGIKKSIILQCSGNPIRMAYSKGMVTWPEYRECCKLVHIEEYDTKEEALNRESELIKKFKEHYGNQCLNKADGNMFGTLRVPMSEEQKRKLSESQKGKLLNRQDESKRVQQFSKEGLFMKEYPSIQEAERQTGVDRGCIRRVASQKPKKDERTGKYYIPKFAGNFIWRFAS